MWWARPKPTRIQLAPTPVTSRTKYVGLPTKPPGKTGEQGPTDMKIPRFSPEQWTALAALLRLLDDLLRHRLF